MGEVLVAGGLGRDESGEGLAEGLGDRGGVAVETDDGMLLVDEHFDARGDHQAPAAGRARAGALHGCQPAEHRPADTAAAGAREPGATAGGLDGEASAPSTAATRRSIRSPVRSANSRVIASSVAPSIWRSLMARTCRRWR